MFDVLCVLCSSNTISTFLVSLRIAEQQKEAERAFQENKDRLIQERRQAQIEEIKKIEVGRFFFGVVRCPRERRNIKRKIFFPHFGKNTDIWTSTQTQLSNLVADELLWPRGVRKTWDPSSAEPTISISST